MATGTLEISPSSSTSGRIRRPVARASARRRTGHADGSAREQTLPVLGPLVPLFPEGALRRGSIVGIRGSGATSLAMAVAAGPSTSGAWTAVVGDPDLGLAAVGELGVALERLLIVRPEPGNWSSALAALVGAVDVVIAAPAPHQRHRCPAHGGSSTERGSVLIHIGDRWPVGADVQLDIAAGEWEGSATDMGCCGHGASTSRAAVEDPASRPVSSKSSCLAPAGRWPHSPRSAPVRTSSPGVPTGPSSPPVSISPSRWRSCTPTASWRPRPVLGPRGSPGHAAPCRPGSVRHACPPRT